MKEDKKPQLKTVLTGNTINLVKGEAIIQEGLKSGFYKVLEEENGMSTKLALQVNKSVRIPENSFNILEKNLNIDQLNTFFSEDTRNIYSQLNFPHKYGIIFFGPQGTGKTTSCYALADHLMKTRDNVVTIITKTENQLSFTQSFITEIQQHSQDILFVVIYDECEVLMARNENFVKGVLDSSDSVDNTLFLFTTNYLEQIPNSIKNRPSRIKEKINVQEIQDELFVYSILKDINETVDECYRLSDSDLNQLVPNYVGKTLDEIKNAYLDISIEKNNKANKNIQNLIS